ncbi:uncharacterized protein TERG_12543 [Trichophyton rubrum CBS 118892]|uniref:Uncharacterized protein n=1 Tax=Trichophyton rubrum (strain ATCC MYA-4607 / CBS 118892) TaxID=559305 RepID=A0A080WQP2_TRIRC|nr:uncharacterized protein TERG_12543 [Trichophyton rubrum CBS 118892]KFL62685.1 hypothetical protein TERG_12543 [Trichophyton rubrum CBS 118892]
MQQLHSRQRKTPLKQHAGHEYIWNKIIGLQLVFTPAGHVQDDSEQMIISDGASSPGSEVKPLLFWNYGTLVEMELNTSLPDSILRSTINGKSFSQCMFEIA